MSSTYCPWKWRSDEASLVDLSCKADFRKLGPTLGSRMKDVAAGIAALPSRDVARLLEGETLEVAGTVISADDVMVQRVAHEGVVVETAGPLAVALDTSLDDDLVVLGTAREIVSRVQGVRRELDLAVTDRIAVAKAFAVHGAMIATETLATTVEQGTGSVDAGGDDLDLRLAVSPV
jgi:isoleucyl-tRNA synthetase